MKTETLVPASLQSCTLWRKLLSVPKPSYIIYKIGVIIAFSSVYIQRLSGLPRGTKKRKIHFGRNSLTAAAFSLEQEFYFRGYIQMVPRLFIGSARNYLLENKEQRLFQNLKARGLYL